MVVAILILELRLEGCHSLKDKRHMVRGLIERAKSRFGVAIAEVGDQNLWGNATLCAAYPSGSARLAESVVDKVALMVEESPAVEVLVTTVELWRP